MNGDQAGSHRLPVEPFKGQFVNKPHGRGLFFVGKKLLAFLPPVNGGYNRAVAKGNGPPVPVSCLCVEPPIAARERRGVDCVFFVHRSKDVADDLAVGVRGLTLQHGDERDARF
ncbi:MAG TPA: hypothetical protein VF628_13235 [Allosphingosinicella sp.]